MGNAEIAALYSDKYPCVSAQHEVATLQRQYTKFIDAYGCLGVMQLNTGLYICFSFQLTLKLFFFKFNLKQNFFTGETPVLFLIVVTGCVSVGKLVDSEIFKITNTVFISLRCQQQDEERVMEVRKLLNSGTFFFSRPLDSGNVPLDLTLCAQKRVNVHETDNRFFW